MNTYEELYHHGVKGMKWGIRRFQNRDGSLTPRGQKRRDQASDAPNNSAGSVNSTSTSQKKGLSRNAKIALGVALGVAGATAIGVVAAKNFNKEKMILDDALRTHGYKSSAIDKNHKMMVNSITDNYVKRGYKARDAKYTLDALDYADLIRDNAKDISRFETRGYSKMARKLNDSTLDRLGREFMNDPSKELTNREILKALTSDYRDRRRHR